MSEPSAATSAGWGKRISQDVGLDAAVDQIVVGQEGPRRYQVTELLGRGGMGEVFLATDERVGRGVALKVLLDLGERQELLRARFFREARVQGNLEHPGIVPVYDLDRDATGRDFFAMKRVAGVTLERVVRDLAKGDPDAEAKYPMRRLLAAFLQVCLAVDYAHSNGVVHRDLKLSNLMLGDFGEVYVLDWGVAKVVGTDEFTRDPITGVRSEVNHTNNDMLGTLGYMAPEQILDSTAVDARADVYALGVILFTLLTHERLHTQKNRADLANSTCAGADARASVRAPHLNIPPELDVMCVKATAVDPDQRYPSARALHDEVQRFLDGDRDTRLRIEVAERHLSEAKRVLASTDEQAGGATERRRTALQQTARALAVHPESEEAAALMSSLMLTPPDELPPEVELETSELSQSERSRLGAVGAAAMLAVLMVAISVLVWVGVRSWATMGVFLGLVTLSGITAVAGHLAPSRTLPHMIVSVLLGLATAVLSRVAGPFILSPLFALAYIAFISGTHGLGRWRLMCFAIAIAGVLVPFGLEAAGLIESQYVFEAGAVRILEGAVELSATRVKPALFVVTAVLLIGGSAILWHNSSIDVQTRRQLQLMAWHLRQLAPAPETKSRPASNADGVPKLHSSGEPHHDRGTSPSSGALASEGPPSKRAGLTADDEATHTGRHK